MYVHVYVDIDECGWAAMLELGVNYECPSNPIQQKVFLSFLMSQIVYMEFFPCEGR